MLEGLEAAEVHFSHLNEETRYEAQYHLKKYLKDDSALKKHELIQLGEIAYITDGPHGYHEVDDSSPIHMLTAKCAKNWRATTDGADRISTKTHETNLRSSLKADDLILSTRGTVGLCAHVGEEVLPANIDQDVARIDVEKQTKSFKLFLCAYLNSSFGQDHIERVASGMVQQGISLQKVREIPVPILDNRVIDGISNLVTLAFRKRAESKEQWDWAESKIISALRLESWQPPNSLIYENSANAVFSAARWDSKFFQPKFDKIRERIEASGICCELGEVTKSIARGRQPSYAEIGVPVLNSKHILKGEISNDKNNRLGVVQFNSIILQFGDVLMNGTGVGTMGRAAVYLEEAPALPDNHVTVIRVLDEEIDPVYLAVLLNSQIGQMQVDQFYKGSSGQIELYPEDIAKFLIWRAPSEIQMKVRAAVEEGRKAKQHSKALLERAKRAVEIAIEQDEKTALAYLDGKHYVADELLPKLFGLARHYVDLDTIQRTLEAEAIHYESSTIARYLHEWQREGRLHDAGRGWYSDLPEPFTPEPNIAILRSVQSVLRDEFPLLDHTLWSTRELNAFFHHLPTRHATYLMVDRDALDPVAEALSDAGLHVASHPLGEIAKRFSLEHVDTVILRPRLSSDHTEARSPIEHTLVDLYHEIQKLGFLEGQEYRHIVRNLATTKRINITALKRYAERRKIDPGGILGAFL